MFNFKTKVFFIVFWCVIFALAGYYLLIVSYISSDKGKTLLVDEIKDVLNIDVKIDKIKLSLFKKIVLQGFKFKDGFKNNFFYLLDIKKIIVKYNLKALLFGKLLQPDFISLEAPNFEFNKLEVPEHIFDSYNLRSNSTFALKVNNGKIAYSLPWFEGVFLLNNIQAIIKPYGSNAFDIDFTALGAGVLNGKISLNGILNRNHLNSKLKVFLKDVAVKAPFFMPLRELNAEVEINNNVLNIKKADFFIRDIPAALTGYVSELDDEPFFDLQLTSFSKIFSLNLSLCGKYSSLKIKGSFIIGNYHYTLDGNVILDKDKVVLNGISINNNYKADIILDFLNGIYVVKTNKDNKDFKWTFSHLDYKTELEFDLHHANIGGYDFVGKGRIKFEPDLVFFKDGRLVFKTEIQTDYLIINYYPINNLNGTALISPDYIEKIYLSWGNVYELTGNIKLGDKRRIDAELKVDNLVLKENDKDNTNILSLLIPVKVNTVINGDIKFNGDLDNPQIEGYIRGGPGNYRNFHFKKGIIVFYGDKDMLVFKDSKIYHSSDIFYLKGKVDLTKKNKFNDVVIESGAKIVLWRGWDMSREKGADEIKIKKALSDNIELNLYGKYTNNNTDDMLSLRQGAGLEYKYEDDSSLSLNFEGDNYEDTISLKHKFSF